MITILREAGFRIVIFTDDHEPAHVHVYGDGDAKVQIAGERAELVWVVGMKAPDIRKMMTIVERNRDRLLAAWRDIHG